MVNRVVFLDRDGVICENRPDYVKSWAEFSFLPGVFDALAALKQAGYRTIVVTNQSAIGRGHMTLADLHHIHSRMLEIIRQHGGDVAQVFHCPHRPDEACRCRKPKPGMLLNAARALEIDLSRSFMVGDASTDILAGQSVGCRCFLVLTGRGTDERTVAIDRAIAPFEVVSSLASAVGRILSDC